LGVGIDGIVDDRHEHVIVVRRHHHVFPAETAGCTPADDLGPLERHAPEQLRFILARGHRDVAAIGAFYGNDGIPTVHLDVTVQYGVDARRELFPGATRAAFRPLLPVLRQHLTRWPDQHLRVHYVSRPIIVLEERTHG